MVIKACTITCIWSYCEYFEISFTFQSNHVHLCRDLLTCDLHHQPPQYWVDFFAGFLTATISLHSTTLSFYNFSISIKSPNKIRSPSFSFPMKWIYHLFFVPWNIYDVPWCRWITHVKQVNRKLVGTHFYLGSDLIFSVTYCPQTLATSTHIFDEQWIEKNFKVDVLACIENAR